MPFTIHSVVTDIRQGRTTPVDLLEQCLARIDRAEEKVRAWVFVDRARARAEAEQMTAELKRGTYRGPLHGIPLAIKDIFDVFDWPTAAGSRLWAQAVARRDATVVERLRQAGAVLMGKTVTTQYASFDPPVTRNPWNLDRTPAGSSSGSAAAVACGMCFGALGSQTGGSITRPASYCGVAGWKPTFARVSVDGVMPLAHSMDHVGPIASCVSDLGAILHAIAGPDPRDPTCSKRTMPNLWAALAFAKPRLGRVRGLFEDLAAPSVCAQMDEAAEKLQAAGATFKELALPAGFGEVIPSHRIVMAVESAAYHRHRLERHPEDYQPKIRALLEEGMACPADVYARCKELQKTLTRDTQTLFQDVDALLVPATTGPAPDTSSTGDPAFNSPWSFTGLPSISFPSGHFADGLPLCVQLVGPAWGEAGLFSAALWCEAVLKQNVPPREPPVVS